MSDQHISLYNLKSDPMEMINLIGNNPEKAKYQKKVNDLKSKLKDWMIKTKTPFLAELDNTIL